MKKVIFTLVIVCFAAMYSHAQFKPEGGTFTTELQFSPFSSQPFSEVGIRGRYFFNDNLALRLNLDFGITSSKVESGTGTTKATAKYSETTFSILPGIEYHLGNMERVSPYVGAELGFTSFGTKAKVEGDNYTSEITNGGSDRDGYNELGIGIVLGVDFYIVQGLYMGAELGFGFGMATAKKGEESVTVGGSNTTNKYEDKASAMNVGFNCIPQIRLGWRF